MDVLKEIEKQIESIKKNDDSSFFYLDLIFTHITRAEFYYVQGKKDSNFFNDVIYRTNQAFEGALKEAYKVLADQNDDLTTRKTPNDIEKYFEQNSIFRERVLELFKNYRQEWRNKSTHDFRLLFDENEAFIALNSVTSFVHLLLKQIQEKIAYNLQQQILKENKEDFAKLQNIKLSKEFKPIDKLSGIIIEFIIQKYHYIRENKLKEYEIIGLLSAFLDFSDKKNYSYREPALSLKNMKIRPDFLVNIENENLILEIKKAEYNDINSNNAINQMLSYLSISNNKFGLIYFANFKNEKFEIRRITENKKVNGVEYEINIITT